MTVAQAAERWLSGRISRQELAPSTVASYRHHLANFAAFVGPDRPLAEIDESDFEGWLGQLCQRSGEPLQPAAANTRASTVRAFAGWAARRRLVPVDFTAGVGRAKVPTRPPKRIPPEHVRALLDVADARERAVLRLVFGLGLRRAEVAGLRFEHWDRHRDELEVTGKGNRVRVLPVAGPVRDALALWLDVHQLGLPARDLALVAVHDAGVGSWAMPRLRVEHWDAQAATLTVRYRHRVRVFAFEGEAARVVGLHVASLPGGGQRPGPLFPSAFHRRPDEALAATTCADRVSVTRAMLAAGRPEPSRWLFPSDRRPDRPLSLRRMSDLFVELGQRAELAKRLHPHVGRHTFATSLVERGTDLAAVRDLLGHSSLAVTSIYVSSNGERMREAVDQLDY